VRILHFLSMKSMAFFAMPSPVERAAQVYQREECASSFQSDLEAHLLNGYVFSTPQAFAMGRPLIGYQMRNILRFRGFQSALAKLGKMRKV